MNLTEIMTELEKRIIEDNLSSDCSTKAQIIIAFIEEIISYKIPENLIEDIVGEIETYLKVDRFNGSYRGFKTDSLIRNFEILKTKALVRKPLDSVYHLYESELKKRLNEFDNDISDTTSIFISRMKKSGYSKEEIIDYIQVCYNLGIVGDRFCILLNQDENDLEASYVNLENSLKLLDVFKTGVYSREEIVENLIGGYVKVPFVSRSYYEKDPNGEGTHMYLKGQIKMFGSLIRALSCFPLGSDVSNARLLGTIHLSGNLLKLHHLGFETDDLTSVFTYFGGNQKSFREYLSSIKDGTHEDITEKVRKYVKGCKQSN